MIKSASWSAAAILAFVTATTAYAENAVSLPSDTPVEVKSFELACTGIGDEAQSDPRWKAFPVRLEFAGGKAQYLADVEAAISDASGRELFKVRCDSPWLLIKLEPGKYHVKGTFRDIVKTTNFMSPKKGQARIIVRFPEIVGNGDN